MDERASEETQRRAEEETRNHLLNLPELQKLDASLKGWPAVLFDNDPELRTRLQNFAGAEFGDERRDTAFEEIREHLFQVIIERIHQFLEVAKFPTAGVEEYIKTHWTVFNYQLSQICLLRERQNYKDAIRETTDLVALVRDRPDFVDYDKKHSFEDVLSLALLVSQEAAGISSDQLMSRDTFQNLQGFFNSLAMSDKHGVIRELMKKSKVKGDPFKTGFGRTARALSGALPPMERQEEE